MALDTDATDKILGAVDRLDEKLDRQNQSNDERFVRIEEELAEHRTDAEKSRKEFAEFASHRARQDADFADSLSKCARAAANATDIALEAKRVAGRSVEEATTIVESAIKMHSASIASTVSLAMTSAVGPLVSDVDKLKTSTSEQDKKLDAILKIAKSTASILGHKKLRAILLACAALGAVGGGAVAGYYAHEASAAAPTSLPR